MFLGYNVHTRKEVLINDNGKCVNFGDDSNRGKDTIHQHVAGMFKFKELKSRAGMTENILSNS